MLIEGDVEVPEITERQVWNTLTKLKRTATGPDNIPFWIWKDHARNFSLHSPVPELSFLPAPYRGCTRASQRRVQDNCMRMLRTPPFFPPKSGEKPYLEVLSRFGLWRDFLNREIKIEVFRHFPRTANVKKSRDHCVGVRFAV